MKVRNLSIVLGILMVLTGFQNCAPSNGFSNSLQGATGSPSTSNANGSGSPQTPAPNPGPQPMPMPQPAPMPAPSPAPVPVSGNEFFVSTWGSDSNNGSTSSPFKTIQKAVSMAKPGDAITVRTGNYSDLTRITSSGTETAPITLRAEFAATVSDSSKRTVLTGSGTGYAFEIKGQHWIVDGFEIANYATAMFINTGGHFATVRQNLIRSNQETGITCWQCDDALIEKNEILDLGPPYPEEMYAVMDYGVNLYYANHAKISNNYFFGKFNHGISLKNNDNDTLISQNTFEGCMYQCIELGQNSDNSTEGDKTSQRVVVEYNVFRDAADSKTGVYYRHMNSMTLMNIYDAVIRFNYFENNLGSPVKVYYDTREGDYRLGVIPAKTKVYGNTMTHPLSKDPHSGEAGASRAFTIWARQGSPEDVVEIDNNTMVGFYVPIYKDTGTQTLEKNNLSVSDISNFVGPISSFEASQNPGPRPIYSPDWSAARSYHLKSGSSAMDAGTDMGLPFLGKAPDLGSNEFIP